jgi:hypothetical protein
MFPDLEMACGTDDEISKAFNPCFDISSGFRYWYMTKLGISCNIEFDYL